MPAAGVPDHGDPAARRRDGSRAGTARRDQRPGARAAGCRAGGRLSRGHRRRRRGGRRCRVRLGAAGGGRPCAGRRRGRRAGRKSADRRGCAALAARRGAGHAPPARRASGIARPAARLAGDRGHQRRAAGAGGRAQARRPDDGACHAVARRGAAGSWSGPFGWIVIAEPLRPAELRSLAAEVGAQAAARRGGGGPVPRAGGGSASGSGNGTPRSNEGHPPVSGASACWPAGATRRARREWPGCSARRRDSTGCRTR